MSSAAKITTPGASDDGKVPQYNAGTDTWDLGPAPLPAFGVAAGYYYTVGGSGDATVALTLNRLLFAPFRVGRTSSFDRIAVEVTVAGSAGALIRLGVYNSAAGLPSTVAFDAGTVASDSTGTKEITISQTLAPGAYWLAAVAQTAVCTIRTRIGTDTVIPLTAPAAQNAVAVYIDSVSGALPTFSGTATAFTHAPKVYLRAA